jgi:hypothetical protein
MQRRRPRACQWGDMAVIDRLKEAVRLADTIDARLDIELKLISLGIEVSVVHPDTGTTICEITSWEEVRAMPRNFLIDRIHRMVETMRETEQMSSSAA